MIGGPCADADLLWAPDESTVRKLTRRIGAEAVNELTRVLIVQARAGRPQARGAGRGAQASGAGSLAGDGSQAAGADAHDPSPLRRGEGRGPSPDRADRRVAGAVGQGDQAVGG